MKLPELKARVLYRWQRLDGFLQLALLLAVANLAAMLFWLPAAEDLLDRLTQEKTYLSGQRAAKTAQPGALPQYFPSQKEINAIVRRINALAEKHEVLVSRSAGHYQVAVQDGQIVPYKLDLQVSGDYQSLRALIDELLRELPYVAISDLSLTRSSIEDAELQMPLNLLVFLHP